MAEEIIEQGYRELADTILEHNPGVDLGRVRAAFELADRAHSGQKRKAGTPYVTHCVAAAQICAEMGLDEDSIVAALLHDCIEDTAITHEDIARQFGAEVADIVEGVTKLPRVQFTSREDEQMENLRKMLMAMAKDIRVILIKIADRLHNMRTMEYMVAQKQLEKSLETMEIYAPIAHRLGLQKVKWELEDRSLKYLDPDGYREIITYLDSKADVLNEFMSDVKKKITDRLTEYSIHATVQSRIKHTYSIYRKMYTQKRGLDEIFDLCAFRVIVDDIPDCYNVLGHIHDMFRPVPGRFKDYIATPKPNGYQSVHTTVLGEEGIMFEVQIRTWEMHETAEYGIAAHWMYKEGRSNPDDLDSKLAWLREALSLEADSNTTREFIENIRKDFFGDYVYVLTPQGKIIDLVTGSTPIDFAYRIHSNVGNHVQHAKVNGALVRLDYKLKNNDVVEIITSPNAAPSYDWLKIAKTQQAKAKIRTWFKKANREENIQRGKDMLSEALKRQGAQLSDFTGKKEYFEDILKKFNMSDLDDVYASIGYGGITTGQVTNKLLEQAKKEAKAAAAAERLERLEEEQQSRPENRGNGKGVIVEGDTGMVVRFARCCTPLPGDDIIGYVTRGRGVSIHRKDCPNIGDLLMDPERVVRAEWANNAKSSYTATIQVVADERTGLLMDVSQVLAGMNISITAMTAKVDKANQNIIQIQLSFDVSSTEQLNNIIKSMRKVRSVKEVYRVNQ